MADDTVYTVINRVDTTTGGPTSSFFEKDGVTETTVGSTPDDTAYTVTDRLDALTGDPTSSFYKKGTVYEVDLAAYYLSAVIAGGALTNSEWLFGHTFEVPLTFPANLVGSAGTARTGATAPSALSLLKNGTQFGTLTFTGSVGTFACPTTFFAAGDLLEIVAPAVADNTLARLTLLLFGTRQ